MTNAVHAWQIETRALDRNGQRSLVLCAAAGDSSRENLSSLGNISLELVHVLIIDTCVGFVSAEYTNLFPSAGHSSLHGRIALVGAFFLVERPGAAANDGFMNVPEGIDEELPFN